MVDERSLHASQLLRETRLRREELGLAMDEATRVAAAGQGPPDERWRALDAVIDRLSAALAVHVQKSEADNGLLQQVVTDAPRLVPMVERLKAEHRDLEASLAEIRRRPSPADGGDLDALEKAVLALLADIERHRDLGATTVYDAYTVDINAAD
jgi:hypothetical protein